MERMEHEQQSKTVNHVALLGNFLPRHCGIATFTSDLTSALSTPEIGLSCGVVAMNDPGKAYAYDSQVLYEVAEGDITSYGRASDFLNAGGFDVLCVQHEYGIFGGRAGAHLLTLLDKGTMPVVTTLHTVLGSPSSDQREVMEKILALSSRVIVMSHDGAKLLKEVHGFPAEKIDVIPHGIPFLPDRQASRHRLLVEDTIQLLTFGLLSPDKGIEYVIDALPAVIERFPTVQYVVVGATHPQVKESQGETYRRSLQLRAHKLGVSEHLVFHDRFVSARELGEFLSAADIYLTPYLNPEQITSGTLAYAVGTGKAVISTPYRYAQEILSDGRGVLVPWRNSAGISDALIRLLDNPDELDELRKRAATFGLDMTWPSVASQYKESFTKARLAPHRVPQHARKKRSPWGPLVELPELDLSHLITLSDDTGILQHARYSIPRYEDGYCIDDNARALLLTTMIEQSGTGDPTLTRRLSARYLAFIAHAFNEESSRFRNFMSFSRTWLEETGSEDSHGRTVWALGTVVGRCDEPGRKELARQLFLDALSVLEGFSSPRAVAFALLGIAEYLHAFEGDRDVTKLQRSLSTALLSRFPRNWEQQWPWCEEYLTYDNARIPQALLVSGRCLADDELIASGLGALKWLCKIQTTKDGTFAPVGSNGFYRRGEEKAQFDQQPVEACATVSACLDAWHVTGDEAWAREMWRAFSWFLGENESNTPLYDPQTKGCRDGLHPDRPNQNQGAESTLSFLLGLVDMHSLAAEKRIKEPGQGVSHLEPST